MAFYINKEISYILIYYRRVKYNNDALCWNWRKSCMSKTALNPRERWKEQEVVLLASRWVVERLDKSRGLEVATKGFCHQMDMDFWWRWCRWSFDERVRC